MFLISFFWQKRIPRLSHNFSLFFKKAPSNVCNVSNSGNKLLMKQKRSKFNIKKRARKGITGALKTAEFPWFRKIYLWSKFRKQFFSFLFCLSAISFRCSIFSGTHLWITRRKNCRLKPCDLLNLVIFEQLINHNFLVNEFQRCQAIKMARDSNRRWNLFKFCAHTIFK